MLDLQDKIFWYIWTDSCITDIAFSADNPPGQC